MAAVDLLIGCLVLVVIKSQGATVDRHQIQAVLLPALAFSLASTTLALMSLITLMHGWLGVTLLALAR